jgi:Tol biopolymer transport system component
LLENAKDFSAEIAHNSSSEAWSPYSQWVYFTTSGDQSNDLVRVRIHSDGTSALKDRETLVGDKELTSFPYRGYPAPSTSYVAFVATHDKDNGPWELFLQDLDRPERPMKSLLNRTWLLSHSFILNPKWRPQP